MLNLPKASVVLIHTGVELQRTYSIPPNPNNFGITSISPLFPHTPGSSYIVLQDYYFSPRSASHTDHSESPLHTCLLTSPPPHFPLSPASQNLKKDSSKSGLWLQSGGWGRGKKQPEVSHACPFHHQRGRKIGRMHLLITFIPFYMHCFLNNDPAVLSIQST